MARTRAGSASGRTRAGSASASVVRALVLAGSLAAACGDDGTGPADATGCLGSYPEPSSSPYVLPYPVGRGYVVGQGNCSDGSHAPGALERFAYDFLMPIGSEIVAARDGTVLLVEERFHDGTRTPGEENYVNVVHDDGTIAAYVHLTEAGALVAVGERVARGQVIARSGDTGSSSEPHLHFHVQGCSGCPTVPITFRNTAPHPNGLLAGRTYVAEPY